ncbi:MAG: ABC transporter ATP-binding protein [Euryarchaeota archaeon]|nr:ABC transporter ATP-binding protein [Euryarchaeota archaeon]
MIIRAEHLCKTYRIGEQVIEAVKGVDLEIERGKFVSIVGHSGSGKTTLLSMLGGLTRPTHGRVYIDGVDIWELEDDELSELRNTKIGFMFQFSSLIPTLTAVENVMLPVAFSRRSPGDIERRALELLEMVGLSHRTHSSPSQLSGGEQRRVAIARALINDPDIILADEPTGDLDRKTEEEVMELFLRINREMGKTFLMVTHNPELARQTDVTLVMENGCIIAREDHG